MKIPRKIRKTVGETQRHGRAAKRAEITEAISSEQGEAMYHLVIVKLNFRKSNSQILSSVFLIFRKSNSQLLSVKLGQSVKHKDKWEWLRMKHRDKGGLLGEQN